jgi:hypothetical protein
MRTMISGTVAALVRNDYLWLVPIAAFFVATTRWLSWSDGIAVTGGQDVYQYELMSRVAPSLPVTEIGSAYTARFVIHWSVGTISALSGVSLELTYRIACLMIMVAFALTVRLILIRLGVTRWVLCLGLALAVLNPYALRYYALVPGYLSDVVFQFGLALAILGTVSRRAAILVAGVVIAAFARQTTVVVAPVLAVWFLIEGRREPRRWAPWTTALVTAVAPFVVLALVGQVTRRFTSNFSPRFPEDTILPLLADLPSTAAVLADHVLRVSAPLLLVAGMLFALIVLYVRRRRSLLLDSYMCAIVSAAIVGQPLLIGPAFPGFAGNEPRLSALGFLPLVLCLATAFRGLNRRARSRPAIALMLLVALASLHHIYTWIGPANAAQFLAVQASAAFLAFVLILVSWRPARMAEAEPGPLERSGHSSKEGALADRDRP